MFHLSLLSVFLFSLFYSPRGTRASKKRPKSTLAKKRSPNKSRPKKSPLSIPNGIPVPPSLPPLPSCRKNGLATLFYLAYKNRAHLQRAKCFFYCSRRIRPRFGGREEVTVNVTGKVHGEEKAGPGSRKRPENVKHEG